MITLPVVLSITYASSSRSLNVLELNSIPNNPLIDMINYNLRFASFSKCLQVLSTLSNAR